MERLTRWNGQKYVLPQGCGSFRRIAERLAAYENTGLEPDEITRINEQEGGVKVTDYNRRLDELFDELVPESGKSDTKAGEIVRAIMVIAYRYYNDGDHIGIDYGKMVCNPSARFLMENTTEDIANLLIAIWGMKNEGAYRALLKVIQEKVVEYVDTNPRLRSEGTDDLIDYLDPCEDYDSSPYFLDEYDETEEYMSFQGV